MKDRESRYPGRYRAVMNASDVSNMQSGNQFNITLVRDDDPIEPGTPFSKETILPDELIEALGVGPGAVETPADFLREITVLAKGNQYDIDQIQETLESLGPGGGITDEEFVTKVVDIVVTDLTDSGPINASTYDVAEVASEDTLNYYDLIRPDEDAERGYSLNVVTKEQHEADIQDAKDLAQNLHDSVAQSVDTLRLDVYDEMYVRAEVDAMVAESKAVIVTVSGTTPSHTSQEIYALIQAGKVVYLELWGNTYTLCTACTASEAKFENSYITSAKAADGKSYQAQQFRVYLIKNGVFNNGQAVTVPGTAYIDAQIAHALGQ